MIVDKRDFEFLFQWLDMDGLLSRQRFASHDREVVNAVIELATRLGENDLAPHLRAWDSSEPQLDLDGNVTVLPSVAGGVRKIAEAGIFAMVFDETHGGLQLPHLVYVSALGILMAGNLGTASFTLLTVGNARLLANYASPAQIATFAEPQIAGVAMGTMRLSEPHAGSSLGDILARAVLEGEDRYGARYRLTGSKMWISAGDHDVTDNIVHLVLAKVPAPDGHVAQGTRGISLFIVPKILPDGTINDVAVAGLNHKMGYRALPNCALNFGEGKSMPGGEAGAIGWRVGEVGQGLPQMFQMMNEARISVGLAGAMLANRGYQMSRDYALERTQGRRIGAAVGAQVPIIEHADVRRMLLAQKAIGQGALALVLFSARLLDDEKTATTAEDRAAAASLLALLTPATKTWPSEWAQHSLHLALQVYGGAGYSQDFEIEQLYRDNRLNPIHEGTTGIQGLDLISRKLRRDGGIAFAALAERIRATIAKVGVGSSLSAVALAVGDALSEFEQAVAILLAEAEDAVALAHGSPVLAAFGHLVVGWLWLDQAILAEALLAIQDRRFDTAFLNGRIRACRYFAEAELPQMKTWLVPVLARSDLIFAAPIDEF
ncbi:alkylation response protein AidB-like acyl-CoA dehydrogenase [Sphingobium xenophagum]|uniref:Alkylation response protein AidB-like acyl-CoA dehydrogenase n=1 Tax=Sphingobium xenophagum TaxID=121428 RepID=A0ABU1X6E0_SPHXE|nr:acyl-CoA dehydrogenase [Sphingobium xenophagum]MDR7156864.1 alkylation response protein AidB-like acyl-CoA dehydrogenase [Sphingobium xenophagum]